MPFIRKTHFTCYYTWQPAFWSVGVMLRIPRGVIGCDHVDEGWLEVCVVGALPLLPAANAARTPLEDTRAGLAWRALRQPLPNILTCVQKYIYCGFVNNKSTCWQQVVFTVESRFKRNIGTNYFFSILIFLSKQACCSDIFLGITQIKEILATELRLKICSFKTIIASK